MSDFSEINFQESLIKNDITVRYQNAVDSLVEKLKSDPNVIAVLLCGSLAHDKVWKKSDIDIILIVRDQNLSTKSYCIDEDGLLLNVGIMQRTDFIKSTGRARGGGIEHSSMAKGKMIFTKDDSLIKKHEEMKSIGSEDIAHTFFDSASNLIGIMEKIEKWLTVKNDLLYSQMYIVYAASMLANMKLILLGKPASREAVLEISELDSDFIADFYQIPLSRQLTRDEIESTLGKMEKFLHDNLKLLSRHALSYLGDGEIHTVTDLVQHFKIHSHGITHIFDYLVLEGVIERANEAIRITPSSKKSVDEIAYIYINER